MREYDLAVIGADSGLDVAAAAANRGQDVAVVDDGPLGGTCLNRCCIPSKMLLRRADVAATIQDAGQFGIDAEITNTDFAGIVREVNESHSEVIYIEWSRLTFISIVCFLSPLQYLGVVGFDKRENKPRAVVEFEADGVVEECERDRG